METDIKNKIEKDFGEKASEAIMLLESFGRDSNLSPRVSRSIIHLSKGDIRKLESNIESAKKAWRDVIYWAEEYDFQFNKSFS